MNSAVSYVTRSVVHPGVSALSSFLCETLLWQPAGTVKIASKIRVRNQRCLSLADSAASTSSRSAVPSSMPLPPARGLGSTAARAVTIPIARSTASASMTSGLAAHSRRSRRRGSRPVPPRPGSWSALTARACTSPPETTSLSTPWAQEGSSRPSRHGSSPPPSPTRVASRPGRDAPAEDSCHGAGRSRSGGDGDQPGQQDPVPHRRQR